MSRKKKPVKEPEPMPLWGLTGLQAELLSEAVEKGPEGAYLPIVGHKGSVAAELVDGGAGEYREVRHIPDPTNLSKIDGQPMGWTDWFLLPTARGLELLKKHKSTKP